MIESHEEILLPVLQLAASVGKIGVVEAVSRLASQHPLRRLQDENLLDPAAPAFQLVASALRSLGAAGLLDLREPLVWSITPAGRQVLTEQPAVIDFEYLKIFAAYRGYWDQVSRENYRKKFLDLRFENYACGRLLFLQGSHNAAAVLLAYAIEYHLKASWIEIKSSWTKNERRLVERSHDLKRLYEGCLAKGLLAKSYISLEFLDYARDHFERRYPRNERELLDSRGYWSFGGSLLQTYDDCIIQLDLALAEEYGSLEYSMGVHAASDFAVTPSLANAFFHENVFAVESLSSYRGALPESRPHNFDAQLLERPDLLFAREGFPHPVFTLARAREVINWNLAACFRYPGKGEPDPDPARLLANKLKDTPHGIYYSKWVIERALKEFGGGAVDITEDRDKKQVILWVFERRATKWFSSIVLRSGFHEFLIRNPANERLVDDWIAQAKAQFSDRITNLRVPPSKI